MNMGLLEALDECYLAQESSLEIKSRKIPAEPQLSFPVANGDPEWKVRLTDFLSNLLSIQSGSNKRQIDRDASAWLFADQSDYQPR